ncbi:MAG: putative type I restriction enzymeP M protein [Deltaproteobacteria bacterium ADurb.Bin135]|jgi:type I restriction enzyme M protein|nr:MAG: putative type I restriction enzymeP M protein [Deltaproteobacteria bacterium ADurb.Bin135]
MAGNHNEIEKKLWEAADQLRANSKLKSSEYSIPVLGLIFLRYADHKFSVLDAELKKGKVESDSRVGITKTDYQARGVLYLPENSRFSYLLNLPEDENMGRAINEAMKAIETENEDLKDVLPKTYARLDNDVLVALIKNFSSIPMDTEGDVFGKIYEYFLGKFAMAEGQRGGEFFTPTSIVKLIVEVIEPYHGRMYDPAGGSGGMFVQSAKFVERHKKNPGTEIAIYGQEKVAETVRLCKMNLAVHGLSGDIRQGNTYYEDIHNSVGKFDFTMANPPFNVNGVDKEKIKDDKRFSYGIPKPDNANYLWIQIFLSALNGTGRAGFVMANSASDARQSELEIRKQMIEDHVVDVIIAIGSNFFYTVTLPCTLWFFDKGKKETTRKDTILFIDARNIYTQVDRAHREFTPEQIEFIGNIVRLYRGEGAETAGGSKEMTDTQFPDNKYQDVPGLCKVATIDDIRGQGYSLNPGRYVGVTEKAGDDFDFYERLEELNEELEMLTSEARQLEDKIAQDITKLQEK